MHLLTFRYLKCSILYLNFKLSISLKMALQYLSRKGNNYEPSKHYFVSFVIRKCILSRNYAENVSHEMYANFLVMLT